VFAVGSTTPAKELLSAAKTLNVSEFFILQKALPPDNKLVLPAQLKDRNVTLIKLSVGQEFAPETDVWTMAGRAPFYHGPVQYFGEEYDADPVLYADAVFAKSETGTLHLYIDEFTATESVLSACLSAQFSVDEEGEETLVRNEITCNVAEGEFEEIRASVAEVWELPEVENVVLKDWKIETTPRKLDYDTAPIKDRFLREMGAIAYCGEVAKEEGGEDALGPMKLETGVNAKGKGASLYVLNDSKNQYESLADCAYDRFAKKIFEPLPEQPEDAEERASVRVTFTLLFK
jgi:hypothetical protein